jgi:hypothetical protein
MTDTSETVWQVLRKSYERQHQALDAISVKTLADEVIRAIDPGRKASIECHWAAYEHIKQMSRALCRHLNITRQAAEEAAAQGELFSERLQDRYPVKRQGEEVYIRRELMTYAERELMAQRLDRVAAGLAEHADALRQETRELLASGHLAFDPEAA